MRPSEFGIWMAMWRISPWDDERADIHAAQIALQVSRSGLVKKGGDWDINDFLPYRRKPKELSDVEKLRKQFGSRVVRQRNG